MNTPLGTTALPSTNTHGLQSSSHHRNLHHVHLPHPLLRRLLLHDHVRCSVITCFVALY